MKHFFYFLNEKHIPFILRWLLIVTIIFLFLYSNRQDLLDFSRVGIFLLAYFLIGITLYFLPRRLLVIDRYRSAIFILDIIFIAVGIYLTQGFDTNLYLACFLVIFIAALEANIKGSVLVTLVVAIFYIALRSRGFNLSFIDDIPMLMQIIFLFVLTLFVSYLAEQVRRDTRKQIVSVQRRQRTFFVEESVTTIAHQLKKPLKSRWVAAACF